MGGRVIVVTSGKGGVGKTTTTANLGFALASLGARVCVVDADIGLRNLDVVLGLENRIIHDLVAVCEGTCRLRSALIKDKRLENLYLLPAAQTRDKDAINAQQMKAVVDELSQEYDYVLIDCPAGIEQGFRNAISGATEAIIVATPEVSSIRDADRIVGKLEHENLTKRWLIANRFRPDMVRRGDMLGIEDMLEFLAPIDLLGIVPEDEGIIVSTNRGEPALLSKGMAGMAYQRIAKRLQGESVPFPDFQKDNLFSKMKRRFGFGGR